MRRICALWLALGLGSLAAAPRTASPAQGTESALNPIFYGSTYLPLGDWTYKYIDLLIARGRLPGLQPLVQPYRRLDVARALVAAEEAGRISSVEQEWVGALKAELATEVDWATERRTQDASFYGRVGAGLKAMSHTHRDVMRPEGDEALFPTFDLYLHGEAPMVAGALRARWDNHYVNDPQFPDGRAVEFRQCDPVVDECAYRVEDAYVEVQLPYARLFFGRIYRNWGLPGPDGLLISDYSYSYDHLGYQFGNSRISLTGLYAPFNDFAGDTARHFSSHRFDWQIRENLVLAVGESVIYGGENRRIDFNLTNPVGVWEISGSAKGRERNALGQAELWWRPYAGLVTYGSFMVDNTSVGNQGTTSGLPQYAAALGIQLPSLRPRWSLRADLSVVSSLAYRSRVAFYEYYTLNELGLAHDLVDAIQFSLGAEWLARGLLVVQPNLRLMWRGADDLRDTWPDDAFTRPDRILQGTVQTTIRPGLAGHWYVPSGKLPWELDYELSWDLALNIIENMNNQPSDWDVEGAGFLRMRFRRLFR